MRQHRLIGFLSTVTVISTTLLMLLGLSAGSETFLAGMAEFMVRFVSVVAGLAVLFGIFNLIGVHLGRFVHAEHGWPYSLVVLVSALVVVVVRILDRAEVWPDDLEGEQVSGRLFEAVQVTLESALAALLVFFLVYAAYRLMRRDVTLWNLVFTLAAVLVLLGWIPLEDIELFGDVRDWLVRVPVSAGARGLLIGVGLGTVMVGVRVLMGQDRSFRS